MPNTEDIQDAVDDLGAKLEATFAARADAEEADPDAADDAPAAGGDQQGDGEPAEGDATPPPAGEGDEDQPPDPEPSAGTPNTSPVEEWAANLPAEVRAQFGQIEAGTHRAIPRSDYEAFQRWQEAQQTPQGAPTFDNLTPEQQAYVRSLQNDYEQLQEAQRQQQYAQQQDGLAELEQTVDTVTRAYAEKHGLDEATVQTLQDHTARMGLLPNLWEQGRTYNPVTGKLSQEANPHAVFERAFDLAMNDHPDLRQRAIDREVATRIANERAAAQAVDGKRRNAASLASVPSAALTRDPRDVRQLSPQETSAAIAEHLRKQMNGASN